MRFSVFTSLLLAELAWLSTPICAQQHQPTPAQRPTIVEDAATVERGRALFKSTCGFCHGNDATGSRGPDLVRSAILNHDDQGNLLGPVIRNGRPNKGMPSFATLKDDQIAAIVAFLHHQSNEALHSAHVPGDYPLAKLLTGNAQEGQAFFNGAGGCSKCHSVTGDLRGIANKYAPIDLQQNMLYPSSKGAGTTGVVTTSDGTRFEGKVMHQDEFGISMICQDGRYRSWPAEAVKIETHDPLAAHRELMNQYTNADVHNLFAYLETLK
ncbi:MAG: c-type cytochrome [Bryobacteraceae bacterium]